MRHRLAMTDICAKPKTGPAIRDHLQAAKVGAIVAEVAVVARSLVPIRGLSDMKVALTPIEFARRASWLYAKREAVIDGDLRYTYQQFRALRPLVSLLVRWELRVGIEWPMSSEHSQSNCFRHGSQTIDSVGLRTSDRTTAPSRGMGHALTKPGSSASPTAGCSRSDRGCQHASTRSL